MKKLIVLFAVIAWLLFILFSYFSIYPLPNFIDNFFVFILLLLILYTASNLGGRVLYYLNIAAESPLKILFSIGLGLAFLSIITFFLGIFGLLYKTLVYAVFTLLLALSVLNKNTSFKIVMPDIKENYFILILSVFLFAGLLGAMTPPTFYDSLVYHLSIPMQYVKEHKIIKIDSNLFSNFPQNIEMLFTFSLLLYNDILANIVHFMFFPLTLAAVYFFTKHEHNKKTAVIAAVILGTTPAIVLLSCGTYIDLGLTFYVFLSFIALIYWTKTDNFKWLVLSAFFAGFTLGIKYTGIIAVIFYLIIVIHHDFSHGKKKFYGAAVFILTVIAVFLPWLIKNFIMTNNPVFPFYLTGDKPYYLEKYLEHVHSHGDIGLLKTILLPWSITMEGIKFGGGFDIIGPIYLLLLPTLFFLKYKEKTVRIYIIFILFYFLAWILTAKVLRFLIPLFPIIAIILAAALFEFVSIFASAGRHIVKIFFFIAVLSNFIILMFIQNFISPSLYVFGNFTKDEYLTKSINPNNFYPAAVFANTQLNENSKVLLVGESRDYYLNMKTVSSSPFDDDVLEAISASCSNPAELLKKLNAEKITHILWNFPEYDRLHKSFKPNQYTDANTYSIISQFRNKYLKLLFENKGVAVFEILK